MASAPALVGLFLLLYLPILTYSIELALFGHEEASRATTRTAWRGLQQQAVLALALAGTWALGWWDAASVGWVWDPWAIPAGAAAWLVVKALRQVEGTLFPGTHDPHVHVRALRAMWPRSRAGHGLVIAGLAVNPFTEELITRGIFVFVVHQATGSLVGGGLRIDRESGPARLPGRPQPAAARPVLRDHGGAAVLALRPDGGRRAALVRRSHPRIRGSHAQVGSQLPRLAAKRHRPIGNPQNIHRVVPISVG